MVCSTLKIFKSRRFYLMDKKTKKKLEVLRQRLEKTQKILAAARQQTDEADEVEQIEQQISDIKAEISKLKNSK